jgi:hypothetical protein
MRLFRVVWPTVALQLLAPPPLPNIGAARFGQRDGLPYRQRLGNYHNVQYHADLEIGGQNVSGIFDTGSFDLVVVSTRCKKCPDPEYNHSASSTYVPEGTEHLHQYGSGPALSRVAYEHVSIGPFVFSNQTFFEMIDHNISALDDASFDAIVGIGGDGGSGEVNSSMMQKIGVKEYSICLEEGNLKPGWLTWGGDLADRATALEMFVIGKHHWAVPLNRVLPAGLDLGVEQKDAAGVLLCKDGCAAVLDSGTSLIAAPSYALQGLSYLLPEVYQNCSNFEDMPILELNLGGHRVFLPPEAYVFRLTGTLVEVQSVWDILHFKPKVNAVDECLFAFMPMDRRTEYGPLWILGMPFFRTYHVQFDSRADERRVWLSNRDAECKPLPLHADKVSGDVGDDYPFPDMVVTQIARRGKRREPLTLDARSLLRPSVVLPL